MEKGMSNRYFKTDNIFHEEILGMFEDSIQKNPDYADEKKNSLITILYSNFYHATTMEVAEARKNHKLIGS